MSERVALGESDAAGRWIGIRRHQAVLLLTGLLALGDDVTRTSAPWAEAVLGVALVIAAAPSIDGLSVAEVAAIALRFAIRSKWTLICLDEATGDGVATMSVRGVTATRAFELFHRGRLDLSGRRERDAAEMARMADALAVGDANQHFSLHVCCREGATRTILSMPPAFDAPAQWRQGDQLTSAAADVASGEATWFLERRRYLRTSRGVLCVLRVRDFSGADASVGLLDRVQFAAEGVDVVVHADVVASRRATRLSARAVHRQGSDDAASRSVGFRRSARSARAMERTQQRETLVARGRALLRVGVYLVVRAPSIRELRSTTTQLRERARSSGLRTERGAARQIEWFLAQLPGEGGW